MLFYNSYLSFVIVKMYELQSFQIKDHKYLMITFQYNAKSSKQNAYQFTLLWYTKYFK